MGMHNEVLGGIFGSRLRLIGGVALVARSHPMLSTQSLLISSPIGRSVGQQAPFSSQNGGEGERGLNVGLGSGMAAALAAFASASEIAKLAWGSSWR